MLWRVKFVLMLCIMIEKKQRASLEGGGHEDHLYTCATPAVTSGVSLCLTVILCLIGQPRSRPPFSLSALVHYISIIDSFSPRRGWHDQTN